MGGTPSFKYLKFTFWSNSTSLNDILKFVTNAQEGRSTLKISILLFHTESQTIIRNSAFSAALFYNKSSQVSFFSLELIIKCKKFPYIFIRSHTWADAIVTRFRSLGFSFTRCSSEKGFRKFDSMIFSHPISARLRAISDLPFCPLTIN